MWYGQAWTWHPNSVREEDWWPIQSHTRHVSALPVGGDTLSLRGVNSSWLFLHTQLGGETYTRRARAHNRPPGNVRNVADIVLLWPPQLPRLLGRNYFPSSQNFHIRNYDTYSGQEFCGEIQSSSLHISGISPCITLKLFRARIWQEYSPKKENIPQTNSAF